MSGMTSFCERCRYAEQKPKFKIIKRYHFRYLSPLIIPKIWDLSVSKQKSYDKKTGVTNFSFIKLSKFNISRMKYSRTLNEVFLKS